MDFPYFKRNKLFRLGVLVNDLRPSTMNYSLIELGNKIAKDHIDIDFYVFHNEWHTPPNSVCFPLLQQASIWNFTGTLISTSLDNTKKLLGTPNTIQKFFYVWDMFEHTKLASAKHVYDIYQHKDLTLLGRSIYYSKILEHNFNRTVETVKDFEYARILELIRYR